MAKKVIQCCDFDHCSLRRIHHERPDESRGLRTIEVDEGYNEPWFCSMTCAIMAGFQSVRFEDTTVGLEAFERIYPNWRQRIEVKKS